MVINSLLLNYIKINNIYTTQIVEDDLRSLMYCDFTPNNDEKLYMEVEEVNKLREVVEGQLDEFNNMSKKPMNLVIFRSILLSCLMVLGHRYRSRKYGVRFPSRSN